MVTKKDTRVRNDGPEARKLFTIKEIVYIISLIVSTIAAAVGTGIFAKDATTTETVRRVELNSSNIKTNENNLKILNSNFENFLERRREVEILKEKNTQLQIDNIERKVEKIENGQEKVMKALGDLLIKVDK